MFSGISKDDLKDITDIDVDKAIVVETASTGFSSKDEFLSISIVDLKGNVILDSLLKPVDLKDWPLNPSYYGITPQDVTNAPDIYEFKDLIVNAFRNSSQIIGYNIEPKVLLLYEQVVPNLNFMYLDIRTAFTNAYTLRLSDDSDVAPVSLKRCARYFGYNLQFKTTLENAKAIAHCFNKMQLDYTQALSRIQEDESKEQAAQLKAERTERNILRATKAILVLIIGGFQIAISLAIPILKIPTLALASFLFFLIFTFLKPDKE